MRILPVEEPGCNAGTATPAPTVEVSADLAEIVRPTAVAGPSVADPDPNMPPGWTPAAWEALRKSAATGAATRVLMLAEMLLEKLGDFQNEFDADVDVDAVLLAKAPIPSNNLFQLRHVRAHFAGLMWPLEAMIDLTTDLVPELPADTLRRTRKQLAADLAKRGEV